MIYAFLKALSDRNSYSKAINSLKSQVDHIYCAVDKTVDYEDPKVTFFVTGNENADLDKFLILSKVVFKNNDHIFICDDDLDYPSDYIEYTLKQSKRFKHNILTYGGSILRNLPIATYYKDKVTVGIWKKGETGFYVNFPYTGVFYIKYTNITKPFVKALSEKGDTHLPFAGDITAGLLLGALKLESMCLSPKEDNWFKHLEIDYSCTIYESFKDNDYEQTVLINKNAHLVNVRDLEYDFPYLNIAVVSTRRRSNHNLLKECLDSIHKQIYPYYDIILIDNDYGIRTIGKCFNEAVEQAESEWIVFIGDDDTVTPDWLATIASGIKELGEQENVVCVTTNITMHDNTEYMQMDKAPTGAWRVSFLKEYPFVEYAKRYVDSHQFERLESLGKKIAKIDHSYGYFYRSHPEQASGHKAISKSSDKHYEAIGKIMKENFK